MPTTTATTVYTDGACQGNPGPGGWAWAVPGGSFRSGAASQTTNQRMELQAVLAAVTTMTGPIEIVSDSTYVVNCFKQRWWEGWERRGWKNAKREDVANQDLWRPLIDVYKADRSRLAFRWVKGHAGDPMNDLVDRLAVEAAARQEGRSGTGTPDRLGPADRSGPVPRPGLAAVGASGRPAMSPASRAHPAAPKGTATIAGHRLAVTGLRPAALGGYGDTLMSASVRRNLKDIIAAKLVMHADLVVISGFGLGTEQLGVEAAADAGVPYVAVLAFPDQDRVWPPASRARFARLIAGARQAIVLESAVPSDRSAAAAALARRDAWLALNAEEAVIVWDGTDESVGLAVRAFRSAVGDESVWVLEV